MYYVNHRNREFSAKFPIFSQLIQTKPFDQFADNEAYHYQVFKRRKQHYDNTLVIGGDHSVAVGSVLGSLAALPDDKRMAVIWIDAHADINTIESSLSGNIHGCPLSFITGLDKSWNWVNQRNVNKLNFKDLYYWGIRDLDNFELEVIDKYGIKVCESKEEVMSIVDEYDYVHTSLDIDGLDPKYAPSTGTKAENGLELDDVIEYLLHVRHENKSRGADLVEYNPDIGTHEEQQTTRHTVQQLLNVML